MYMPEAFREERREVLVGLMRAYGFATVISQGAGGMVASHLPVLVGVEGERIVLRSHMARANSQWRDFGAGGEVMVIFQGPHAYISPSWYVAERAVPTWNYAVVHCYGRARVVEELEAVKGIVGETVRFYEGGRERPWLLEKMPAEYVEHMAKAVVGFEVEVTRIEGKWKMNQNRAVADREGVMAGLRAEGGEMEREVARVIKEGLGESQ
jgi:transcriptional regulator